MLISVFQIMIKKDLTVTFINQSYRTEMIINSALAASQLIAVTS